ncbi:MAG: hypothetical protein U5R46_00870 [Gammaproteobacteria bacterium]|nr:hypothetical protein [Gammaproteobacteria bacterium]
MRPLEGAVLTRLALLGPFVAVPEALFYYRWHDGNASRLMNEPAGFYRWWDPAGGGGRVFPETRLLWEHIRSLWLVRLSPRDRRECSREIRLWYRAQKPVIKWELKQLLPGGHRGEPPRPNYFDKMMRRVRRQQLKRKFYPDSAWQKTDANY